MPKAFARLAVLVAVASMSCLGTAKRTAAQTYPIDCAILLCLSADWPASEPCALVRAEFIRRITPWPIEPPLQIWRCPMNAAFKSPGPVGRLTRLARIDAVPQWSVAPRLEMLYSIQAVGRSADIDVSGPAFNFIRSIDVFDVRASQQGEREGCNQSENVRRRSYDATGQFRWQPNSVRALPTEFRGNERYGENCPSVNLRSVFVDWEDQDGTYGFEQVGY